MVEGEVVRHLPRWARRFVGPARYKCAYGGRSSGKTWAVAHLLVLEAARRPIRVACAREFQSSIRVSAKPALETAIHRLGLTDRFQILEQMIRGVNGSVVLLSGHGKRNREEIRGWEGVDKVWVEEAQRMSEATARVLIPTIMRGERNAEVWATWNPENRTDWVWRRFVQDPRPDDVIEKVCWHQNAWFGGEAESERLEDLKHRPDLYQHIWEGEPNDQGSSRRVLPYSLIEQCVDAFRKGKHPGMGGYVEMGLDIADTGNDQNAMVTRCGPTILHAEEWRSAFIGDTARRAHAYAKREGIGRVNYDVGGIGAGIRSYFNEFENRPYATVPVNFGGAVMGAERRYTYRTTNAEHFLRRNSQLAFALRMRAMNTQRLIAGDDIDPHKCLFISTAIPNLSRFLAQLSQPEWDDSQTGKVMILKQDEDEPSPDLYDAAVLAFAQDSVRGLRIS